MTRFGSTAVAFVTALVVGVVLGTWGAPPDTPVLGVRTAGALEVFADCAELEAFLSEAVEAEQQAFAGGPDVVVDAVMDTALEFDAPEAARAGGGATGLSDDFAGDFAAEAAAEPDAGFSTTNIQEAGVDEPDVIKTDGRRVVAAGNGRLHVLTVQGDGLHPAGSVSLEGGWGHELILDGDRVLVLSSGDHAVRPMPLIEEEGRDGPAMSYMPMTGNARLTLVDIADASAPTVVSTMEMDGQYVSARLVGRTARIVLRSYPADPAAAEGTLPHFRTDDEDPAAILPCEHVMHPVEPLGPALTTVLSVDLQGPLAPRGAATVMADAHTVYATADRLYVAFARWDGPEPGTDIHAFDITDADATRYLGAGSVTGTLLNQWALSRHDGHLRVATTEGDAWAGGSHSAITVLAESGGGLTEVGRMDGLGPDERIYAVRYLGDIGFVVTFRETDPLYSLDLSDPANPRVLGELKIPGFSNYLHPIGDGLLLGVGQDADEQGRPLGVALSVFDVRDLANPARIHQITLGQGDTPVAWDHRAFLWWAPRDLAVLPVQLYSVGAQGEWHEELTGAVGVQAGRSGLTETGRLDAGHVERTLVVGDSLLAYSADGITVADLATLDEVGRIPLR